MSCIVFQLYKLDSILAAIYQDDSLEQDFNEFRE